MARRTATFTVTDEGRDKGKAFQLTEMAASQAERWALKAFLALARAGVELPEDFAKLGMAGIARLGFQALAGANFADVEPLLEEMLGCVQAVPDPKKPMLTRELVETDCEEILTRLRLRKEVFALHADFFQSVARSTST